MAKIVEEQNTDTFEFKMQTELGLNAANVHLIGHSLGSHLAGYVGSVMKTNFGVTVGRITGLDPAEPHFSQTDPMVRLDPSDAIYVDIIHTDSRPFVKGGELGTVLTYYY